MTHVLRLLLILCLCIALAPMRGGSMAAAQGGCASQAARIDICVAPGAPAAPALPQSKSCVICTLNPIASLVPPQLRELTAMRHPASLVATDQTFGPNQWRPPRA
ncbi:hypothetical protein QCN27_09070 [Cereibacter sp. SYSU M97828]|nr:hypothetical protein [Cereibacter flavus]